MKYKEFKEYINNLEVVIEKQNRINKCLRDIDTDVNLTFEHHNVLIDNYVSLLEYTLNDSNQSISWFVFENDFGRNKYKITVGKKIYVIKDVKCLYEYFKKEVFVKK